MLARSISPVRLSIQAHERRVIIALLVLAFLIRLPLIATDFGTTTDLMVYRGWARMIAEKGLVAIYDEPTVNYPTVSLYWFGAAGWIESELHLGDTFFTASIKLLPVLADVLTATLIVWVLKRRRVFVCAVYAFNPAIGYVSAYWGQIDATYALFMVASLILIERQKNLPAWVAAALAIGTKIQGLVVLPVLMPLTLKRFGVRGCVQGLAAMAATFVVVLWPWIVSGRIGDVVRASATLSTIGGRVDVSGYNLWYLLLRGRVHNVSSSIHPLDFPLSYQQIGFLLFAGLCVFIAVSVFRNDRRSYAAAATLSLGFFILLTEVHERYMFPTIAFVLLAATQSRGRRGWWMVALLSATFLFNLITIVPFTPLLGINLVAAQAIMSSPALTAARLLSLLVAMLNLIILTILILDQVRNVQFQHANTTGGAPHLSDS